VAKALLSTWARSRAKKFFLEDDMKPEETLPQRRARAPKAAAIAGIVFSVLLITSLVLTLSAMPPNLADDEARFMASRNTILLALNLIPFAGIAFLWFIGVVRDLLGEREDQFFATVFFGSGLLFLAMLFASAAVNGSLTLLYNDASNPLVESSYYDLGHTVASELLNAYGIRMAGVFMISLCTLFIRTRVIPRWMAWLGYGLAALMLLRLSHIDRLGWVFLAFPAWVLLISLYILVDNYRQKKATAPAANP
jgi:hypothetical protein